MSAQMVGASAMPKRFALLLLLSSAVPVMADEQMRVLATSGSWVTVSHSESMMAQPDMCAVSNMEKGLVIRRDESDLEIRMFDKTWSLPADVTGTIFVSVSDFKHSFDITANTSTNVAAVMDESIGTALLFAMDKSSSMTITVGKQRPDIISLQGSTKATNAFRTCARMNGNSPTGGSNPFQ